MVPKPFRRQYGIRLDMGLKKERPAPLVCSFTAAEALKKLMLSDASGLLGLSRTAGRRNTMPGH